MNHRIIEWFQLEGALTGPLVQLPVTEQGHPQLGQVSLTHLLIHLQHKTLHKGGKMRVGEIFFCLSIVFLWNHEAMLDLGTACNACDLFTCCCI